MKYCLLVFVLFAFALPRSSSQSLPVIDGQVLVQLAPGYSADDLEKAVSTEWGLVPQFHVVRCVSAPMRAWLCSYDPGSASSDEMLRLLRSLPAVSLAQCNHNLIIHDRETTPDDPFFGLQWHHHDAEDNDIDSDLAWDITTGGITAFGDTIVACIIEPSGAEWNHADLLANHWVNNGEIPDNGFDDDGNGYIDDYDGWDASDGDDNLPSGNHGTQVSSMIGATGDNNTGISGVNWHVKLMEVRTGSTSNEAEIIEAYTYPLIMRQLYTSSGGNAGAFVVATNASWGIDYGQPEDAPLWCAVYDTLGTYGILNCGATANNNVNIDNVGDLPTACPSDYMIAVTATNSSDVRTFSGYGITTIDLGAPGESVQLANAGGGYGNVSGTSFASPCVVGAIALAYSTPCESFMSIVHANAQTGADLMRQYIFDGVDPVSNLADEVVTGGRLNVNNTIQLILSDCVGSGCVPPFNVSVEQQGITSDYLLTWGITDAMTGFLVHYRPAGSVEWTEVFDIVDNAYLLEDLEACTTYEVEIMAGCGKGQSDWSQTLVFTTEGCCDNPSIGSFVFSNLQPTSMTIGWESIQAAVSYVVVIDDGDPFAYEAFSNSIFIDGLDSCTTYLVNVQTICNGQNAGTPEELSFTTPGCGSCSDFNYCAITGNSGIEWISNVVFGAIANASSADNGYGDYTGISTTIDIGGTYSMTLTPAYSGAPFTEYFKVWIDFNQDGELDEVNELAYDAGGTTTTAITGDVVVPWSALAGSTRMRIGMSWLGAFGGGQEPTPCGNIPYGETEDYCVFINTDVSVGENPLNSFMLYPNPASDHVTISGNQNGTRVSWVVFDALGSEVIKGTDSSRSWNIDTQNLAAGTYSIVLHNGATGLPALRFVVE